jgi:hypothetical protein
VSPSSPGHKDVLLFRVEEQATWDRLLPRRYPPRLSQMASHRRVGGDVRFSQSFWGAYAFFCLHLRLALLICSVAPIRVPTIPLRSMSLPLTISSKHQVSIVNRSFPIDIGYGSAIRHYVLANPHLSLAFCTRLPHWLPTYWPSSLAWRGTAILNVEPCLWPR